MDYGYFHSSVTLAPFFKCVDAKNRITLHREPKIWGKFIFAY